MLRKSFTICLKKRVIHKLDVEIPPSQDAHRQGRSTTEHVFATNILAGKAITSQCYTIHLLMLDISKAFETVNRAIALKDLKIILNPDELGLIEIIVNTELTESRNFFKTDTDVSKRDGFYADEFTLYLARALYKENNDHICKKSAITTLSEVSSISRGTLRFISRIWC